MVTRRQFYASRRRQRRVKASGSDLTKDQWGQILRAWGCCAYCGKESGPFQKDCVLAISRGGRYTLSNVVPACGSCNQSKSNFEVTVWMRRKRLDEPLFLAKWAQVSAALKGAKPSAKVTDA